MPTALARRWTLDSKCAHVLQVRPRVGLHLEPRRMGPLPLRGAGLGPRGQLLTVGSDGLEAPGRRGAGGGPDARAP